MVKDCSTSLTQPERPLNSSMQLNSSYVQELMTDIRSMISKLEFLEQKCNLIAGENVPMRKKSIHLSLENIYSPKCAILREKTLREQLIRRSSWVSDNYNYSCCCSGTYSLDVSFALFSPQNKEENNPIYLVT